MIDAEEAPTDPVERLRELSTRVFRDFGVPEADARRAADVTVASNPSVVLDLLSKGDHMPRTAARRGSLLSLALTALSVAPAPPATSSKPSPLAQARYEVAVKHFGDVWTYDRQSRTDSFQTYSWSRLVLEAQQDLSEARADRVAALEAHLERMRRLEALVLKVRKLGFVFSTDVGATAYYRLDAQRWLEKARAG